MELYILIGLITIVLILQIVFLLKKPKSENTATNFIIVYTYPKSLDL